MAVSWASNGTLGDGIVRYGFRPNSLNISSATATPKDFYGMTLYEVVLRPLPHNVTVWYHVEHSASNTSSSVASFRTSFKSGSRSEHKVAVLADMGISNSAGSMAWLQTNQERFDFVLHAGDLTYADDRISDYQGLYNEFMDKMEGIMPHKAYMLTPGNHDADCHSIGDILCDGKFGNFSAYNQRWRMPANESGAKAGNMWYSFDFGMVHYIMLDTETDYPDGLHAPEQNWLFNSGHFGDQLAWLKGDLARAQANRAQTPWIIAAGHRPLYTSAKTDLSDLIWYNATGQLRGFVEDLFHKYDVDLWLCGHVHAYERIFPVYRNATERSYHDPSGLPQLVVGGPGNIEGFTSRWVSPDPEWLAYRSSNETGLGVLTFSDPNTMTWEYYSTERNVVIDSFTLTK
jgi:hypothetical protein